MVNTTSITLILTLIILSSTLCAKISNHNEVPDSKMRKSMERHLMPKPPKRSPPPILNTPEYELLRTKIMNSKIFKIAKSYIPKSEKEHK